MRQHYSYSSAETDEDPHGYLTSVSDVVSGLLFLFIITLMVFAFFLMKTEAQKKTEIKDLQVKNQELRTKISQALQEKSKLHGMVKSISGREDIRTSILREIETELKRKGFSIKVNYDQGLLTLPEEVLFPSGSAQIQPTGSAMLHILADVFARVLPDYCKTAAADGTTQTLSVRNADIEAILIEGHTDNVPVKPGSSFADNWELSTTRATNTFKTIAAFSPTLNLLRNNEDFAIFSISGYADQRPVMSNEGEESRRHNRRIDVRFLMSPPETTPEIIKAVGRQLQTVSSP